MADTSGEDSVFSAEGSAQSSDEDSSDEEEAVVAKQCATVKKYFFPDPKPFLKGTNAL